MVSLETAALFKVAKVYKTSLLKPYSVCKVYNQSILVHWYSGTNCLIVGL